MDGSGSQLDLQIQMLPDALAIHILLMFSATWFALFLSKQVTVPIRRWPKRPRNYRWKPSRRRVNVQAQDELGTLVRSHRMTEQRR